MNKKLTKIIILPRFIRLIDCILQNALHNVLLNSIKMFVETVEERFQSGFLDNFERMVRIFRSYKNFTNKQI